MSEQGHNQPISVRDAITRFLSEREQYLSPHTLRDYAINLAHFADLYQGSLDQITPKTLTPFFAAMVPLQPSSRAKRYASLSSFLRWLYRQQLIDHDPMVGMPPIRPGATLRSSTASSALGRLLAVIPPTRLRDRLIFRIIGELGIRAAEVLQLRIEDLDLDRSLLLLYRNTRRQRLLPISASLVQELRQYLTQVNYHTGPLFRSQTRKREEPLRSQTLAYAFKNYSAEAGISIRLDDLHRSAFHHATSDDQQFGWMLQLLSQPETDRPVSPLDQEEQLKLDRHQAMKRSRDTDPQHALTGKTPHSLYLVPTYVDITAVLRGAPAMRDPWHYSTVDGGYCTNLSYSACPHRLVCAHCAFFLATEEVQAQFAEKGAKVHRLLQELALTQEEGDCIQDKPNAAKRLRESLVDVPTPAGPTPRQLHQMTIVQNAASYPKRKKASS